jgi:Zn-dependent peptidase ImmA (M78 family)
VVAGKTANEVYEAAQKARRDLFIGPEGRVAFDMEWLLEKRVRPILGVEIDSRSDDDTDLAGVHAAYSCADKVIKIRESVIRRSMVEDPDAIFTICHEIGHVCMHSNPQFFRRVLPDHLPKKMCDPEWQANLFAVEFLVDRQMLYRYDNPLTAANYFRVPHGHMREYFAQLRAQGVLARLPKTQFDDQFETATQEGFDF